MKGSGDVPRLAGYALQIAYRAGGKSLRLRVWLPWIAVGALVAGMFGTAYAQGVSPAGVRISFTADRPELTVGEIVTLTLDAYHAADHVVVVPRLDSEWGQFEVQSQTKAQTVSIGDGVKTTRKQFQVTLFAPGAFETPSLPITIRSPDGGVERVFTPTVQLTVNSVLSGPDEQLKDIRAPADLSTPIWEQPAARILAAIAVLVALGALGFLLYRRAHWRESPPVPVADTRMPWEIAIQELDRLGGLDLPGSGDLKEHYSLVAAVIRAYLGAMYLRDVGQTDVTDMSTEEIGPAIWRTSLDDRNARLAVELLQEADLVKFANYAPPASRAYEAAGRVRNIVEATRLSLKEATPGGPAARRGATA